MNEASKIQSAALERVMTKREEIEAKLALTMQGVKKARGSLTEQVAINQESRRRTQVYHNIL